MNPFIRDVIFATLLAFNFMAHVLTSVEATKRPKLKFVVFGDIGGVPYRPYSLWTQNLVSQHVAMIPGLDFFLTTGDNFYYRGVKTVNDFRFFATYERVYHYPALQKKWYVIAGNHDYYGNVSAQILYTRKSKRWTFPHFYYTKIFRVPESSKTLQIVMIDTMSLCFGSISKSKHAPPAEKQMEWIKRTLNDSKADYLIVLGHHPMFSVGKHGSSSCLQNMLHDVFKQHQVNAYISGHDHNLQHISEGNLSLQHFVCGSSNWVNNWKRNAPNLGANTLKVFIGDSPGYLLVAANEDKVKFEFRTITPKYKYKIFLLPRNKLPYEDKPNYPKLLKDFMESLQGR